MKTTPFLGRMRALEDFLLNSRDQALSEASDEEAFQIVSAFRHDSDFLTSILVRVIEGDHDGWKSAALDLSKVDHWFAGPRYCKDAPRLDRLLGDLYDGILEFRDPRNRVPDPK